MNEYIIASIIFSISLGALTLISKSYLSKKAENLAQKEDITNLTALVKEVEHNFNVKTEVLKSQLSLKSQIKLGLYNEEKQVIIELHNNTFEIFSLFGDFSKMSEYNNDALYQEIDKYEFQYKNWGQLYDKFCFFISGDDGKTNDLLKEFIFLKKEILHTIYRNYTDYHLALIANNNKLNEAGEMAVAARELYLERQKIHTSHSDYYSDNHETIYLKILNLAAKLKEHLRGRIDDI